MTSKFKQRLKRLHDARLRAADATEAPDSPRIYLADDHFEEPKAPQNQKNIAPAFQQIEKAAENKTLEKNEHGQFRLFTRQYSDAHRHGNYVLGGSRLSTFDGLSALTASAAFDDFRPEEVVYLDIETTGLGGNSYAFCVGLGFWNEGGFLVEQYVMGSLNDEAAMLAGVARRLLAARGLCTFNGQKFDVTRLEDRFRHVGIASPFGHLHRQHADLLPMARKKLKGLKSYRLGALEEAVLNLFRVDDVPGKEIPPLWNRYLRTGQETLLDGVFEHNRIDIVTMPILLSVLLSHSPVEKAGISSQSTPARAQNIQESTNLGSVSARLKRSYALRDRNAKPADSQSSQRFPDLQQSPVRPRDEGYATIGERSQVLREAATVLIARGQTSEALPMLFELAALAPENPFPLEHLARYYRALGNQVFAEHFERRLRACVSF